MSDGLAQSLRDMWGFITSDSETTEVRSAPAPPQGLAALPSKRVMFGRHGQSVGVRSIACGVAHSAAIVGEGELWTWGRNDQGQCGVPLASSEMTAEEADSEELQAFHVEAVHDVLAGGAVTLLACGANFTAVYSTDTHILAVCGAGANEFVHQGTKATAMEWQQIQLMSEDGSDQICEESEMLVQLVAGYGHLAMLTGSRAPSR